MMRARLFSRDEPDDEGAVAILVALLMVVLLVILAFAADTGRVALARTRLQNAVDAAALAGAQEFCKGGGDPTAVADSYLNLNAAANNVTVQGSSTMTTSERGSAYLLVRANSQIPLIFGSLVGAGQVAVAAQATAARACVSGYASYSGTDTTINGGAFVTGSMGAQGNFTNNGQGTIVTVGVDAGGSLDTPPGTDLGVTHAGVTGMPTVEEYAASIGLTDSIASVSPLVNYGGTCILNAAWFSAHPGVVGIKCQAIDVSVSPPSSVKLIWATEDIQFSGKNDLTVGALGSPVIIYADNGSNTGSITVRTNLTVYGYLYAPRQTITVDATRRLTAYGRVLANELTFNGNANKNDITIDSSSQYTEFTAVSLTN